MSIVKSFKVWAMVLMMSLAANITSTAQQLSEAQQSQLQQAIESCLQQHMEVGKVKANSVKVADGKILLDLNESFGQVPFTRESIAKLKADVKQLMGEEYSDNDVEITIQGNAIDLYFADYEAAYARPHAAFITPQDPNRHYGKGLDKNVIALWQSHGWYFEPKLNRWEWQRGRLMQTVEDMYTQSYVVPFLIPMLENAGAYVWDARERDTHSIAAVVDNDGGNAQSGYSDVNGKKKWQTGADQGFAYHEKEYKDFENPFATGTYRQVESVNKDKNLSMAHWDVDMPEAGEYALYISYKSLPGSVKDARYMVNDLGGSREYDVDQTMGGGVWVYLTTVQLKKGMNKDVVTLSNLSKDDKRVVTADAIKVGGGTGNIVRKVAPYTEENLAIAKENGDEKYLAKPGVNYKYVPCGDRPWFTIGSRYYLQWAGFPNEVYSTSHGINDYVDDYRCRGEWVNYLAGGSDVLPNRKGLNIPVDLSLAFHSDAGTTNDDGIIGTLGIYCTMKNGKSFGKYENGTSRQLSRLYTDLVMNEICTDIRAKYEPNWTRRGLRDASYYEARVPEVPAMLLELLSHQNFADMKYGLDPAFRFDVSRAIYKGMLKFLAQRDHRDYVVQPLPVNSFAIRQLQDKGEFLLTWKPTHDTQSQNADPDKYIILERVGAAGGFREIATVTGTEHVVNVKDNEIHSYKIIALNQGGRSFPSEVLSCGVASGSKGTVMVVNGFTRVSAPDWFDAGTIAGFADEKDHGVPYMQQINYVGPQFEFTRALDWRDDDAGGFGASRSSYEKQVVAGNTFDYPAIHGEAIMKAGYSFVSSSVKAIEDGEMHLRGMVALDLILGKQKEVPNGSGYYPARFKAFTPGLISAITDFTAQGGHVLVTGAYVGTDIWNNGPENSREVNLAQNVLGYKWLTDQASQSGEVTTVITQFEELTDGKTYDFVSKLNDRFYAVESPDAITPADDQAATIMRYTENNIPAGVACDRGTYRTVVLGFPFETIKETSDRDALMHDVLNFFNRK
ncbi:MAG: N-acetylmuramoyl-L-alanine amidase [Muribaculaceae bacterium]|nr:N-acetylmuramoyl-L-alanine amidase [Muribaculaceae bacterium]